MRDSILLRLSILFSHPRLEWVHVFFRHLELAVLAPIVLKTFMLGRLSEVRFVFRHSATEPGRFHFLLSDVDFSVLIPENFGMIELDQLNRRLRLARKCFPFLGEAEIFTDREFKKHSEAESFNNEIYAFIRLFRKLQWLKQGDSTGVLTYHTYKARRATQQALSKIRIKACLENPETSIDNPAPILERSMKSWLKLKFADELRSLNSRTTAEIRNQWSAYLEYSIGTHAELNLSSNEALVLLSLVPELLDNSHGLSDRTISLRQEFSRIARYWQQNALIESARQMAWARSQTPVPDWHQSRYEQLCAWRDSKIQ